MKEIRMSGEEETTEGSSSQFGGLGRGLKMVGKKKKKTPTRRLCKDWNSRWHGEEQQGKTDMFLRQETRKTRKLVGSKRSSLHTDH